MPSLIFWFFCIKSKEHIDKNGYTNIDELISKLNAHNENINFEILQYIVDTNNKKRFAFNEDCTKIRASQGHSIDVELG